jgi:hypothetical protein
MTAFVYNFNASVYFPAFAVMAFYFAVQKDFAFIAAKLALAYVSTIPLKSLLQYIDPLIGCSNSFYAVIKLSIVSQSLSLVPPHFFVNGFKLPNALPSNFCNL